MRYLNALILLLIAGQFARGLDGAEPQPATAAFPEPMWIDDAPSDVHFAHAALCEGTHWLYASVSGGLIDPPTEPSQQTGVMCLDVRSRDRKWIALSESARKDGFVVRLADYWDADSAAVFVKLFDYGALAKRPDSNRVDLWVIQPQLGTSRLVGQLRDLSELMELISLKQSLPGYRFEVDVNTSNVIVGATLQLPQRQDRYFFRLSDGERRSRQYMRTDDGLIVVDVAHGADKPAVEVTRVRLADGKLSTLWRKTDVDLRKTDDEFHVLSVHPLSGVVRLKDRVPLIVAKRFDPVVEFPSSLSPRLFVEYLNAKDGSYLNGFYLPYSTQEFGWLEVAGSPTGDEVYLHKGIRFGDGITEGEVFIAQDKFDITSILFPTGALSPLRCLRIGTELWIVKEDCIVRMNDDGVPELVYQLED